MASPSSLQPWQFVAELRLSNKPSRINTVTACHAPESSGSIRVDQEQFSQCSETFERIVKTWMEGRSKEKHTYGRLVSSGLLSRARESKNKSKAEHPLLKFLNQFFGPPWDAGAQRRGSSDLTVMSADDASEILKTFPRKVHRGGDAQRQTGFYCEGNSQSVPEGVLPVVFMADFLGAAPASSSADISSGSGTLTYPVSGEFNTLPGTVKYTYTPELSYMGSGSRIDQSTMAPVKVGQPPQHSQRAYVGHSRRSTATRSSTATRRPTTTRRSTATPRKPRPIAPSSTQQTASAKASSQVLQGLPPRRTEKFQPKTGWAGGPPLEHVFDSHPNAQVPASGPEASSQHDQGMHTEWMTDNPEPGRIDATDGFFTEWMTDNPELGPIEATEVSFTKYWDEMT